MLQKYLYFLKYKGGKWTLPIFDPKHENKVVKPLCITFYNQSFCFGQVSRTGYKKLLIYVKDSNVRK